MLLPGQIFELRHARVKVLVRVIDDRFGTFSSVMLIKLTSLLLFVAHLGDMREVTLIALLCDLICIKMLLLPFGEVERWTGRFHTARCFGRGNESKWFNNHMEKSASALSNGEHLICAHREDCFGVARHAACVPSFRVSTS